MTMATPTPKPHTSPSQIMMHAKCPQQFYRRYPCGEKTPPSIAANRGRGPHKAAQVNFAQKIESHADMPRADIVDIAASEFSLLMSDEVMLTKDEQSRGRDNVVGEAMDAVVAIADMYAVEQAPDYQPVMVEKSFRLALSGPKDLLGILDLADDRQRITDFKTAKRSKTQNDVNTSLQLTTYAIGYKAITGQVPGECRLDVAVTLKGGIKRQVLRTVRDDADFKALAYRIDAMNQSIASGSFPGAPPDAWWCSADWCGYHSTCPFVNPKNRTFVELKGAE